MLDKCSDAGRWKTLGVPVVIGGDNLPSPVGIGLTDLSNIGGASLASLNHLIVKVLNEGNGISYKIEIN